MSQRQQSLFSADTAPWEEDDAQQQLVAKVVVATGNLDALDYRVPESLRESLKIGHRIEVPLGRGHRSVVGYCVDLQCRTSTRRLKDVIRTLDPAPLLCPNMLRLTEWIANYYICPWRQVLESVVPAGVRQLAGSRPATLLEVAPLAHSSHGLKLSDKQQRVLDVLIASSRRLTPSQLANAAGCTTAPINALRKKGLITATVDRLATVESEADAPTDPGNLSLNRDQQHALDAVLESVRSFDHKTVLIHGVTGSGKTEVYMRAIAEVHSHGRGAIVLVPEISLTPQTRERFRRRFGRVALLHSHLSEAQRAHYWRQIAAGEFNLVVGARSAVFAPLPNLGMIVLDEEHESTFKQESSPRYHARDVARRRTEMERATLVLGSATPSLESWKLAQRGDYKLVEMPDRVLGRPLPEVATVDLRDQQHDRRWRGAISRQLCRAMEQALDDGGQVILLLNRRGFSTHIQCPACGHSVRCPDCEIALTHHRERELAICHYCDHRTPAPLVCPECKSEEIRYRGLGTQKLESEVRGRFPKARVLRMDTDSMRGAGSHEKALARFRDGQVDILLGTQMIAKGLDFPNVTLVGVVNADTAMHLPDFRAAERTFHLVTQVAGRS